MGSSNTSWKSSKPHRNETFAREPRTFSADGVATRNMHKQHASATSLPSRPPESNNHTQRSPAPALRATAKVAAHTTQHQPAPAAAGKSSFTVSPCTSTSPSSSKQAYIPPAMRNRLQQQKQEQPVTFAVQLYPDMSSLTLLQHDHQQDSPTMFSGHLPPDHHSYTAFHHYIAHVCPQDAGAFGVDVWLDTFHTTLGDLELPMSKVPKLQSMINSASDSLPPVNSLVYTTTKLQHTAKDNRLKKDIKGVHFYHLGMTAAADQLDQVLQPWMTAMQHAAASVGAKFVQEPFSSHHITIRCHTKKPVERQAFERVAHAVQRNPTSLRVAGIRVQLAASQALEHCGPEHVKIHIGSNGSEVRYPVPIYTSGEAASVLLQGGGTAPGPLRAVPCVALAEDAELAASVEEIARLTAEPLMVPAQNGGGHVWQNEEDTTVPKGELAILPTLPILQGCVPPSIHLASLDLAAEPDTNPVLTAAVLAAADMVATESSPGGSLTDSDPCAEKVAELSTSARPTGPQLAKEVEEYEEDQSLLKAHSQTQTQNLAAFQAMSMTSAKTM